MQLALRKRPVPREAVDEAISRIEDKLLSSAQREIKSEKIGELVMRELKRLDKVAYIRFASVYRSFEDVDEFAEVPIDASDVVWIATANDARSIPEPILNRMNVYAIEAPDEEGARRIAASIYEELRNEHAWGRVFPRELGGESLDRLGRMKPREMRRMMLAAFGNAKLAGRNEVLPEDFTDERVAKKARIGF